MSSGSYKKFTNWLETLATEQPQLPKGFLFFAFDNEQKGQKKNFLRSWIQYGCISYYYDQNDDRSLVILRTSQKAI